MNIRNLAAATALSCALAPPVLAHHSFAMFNQRQEMALEGTVHEFQWTNPHAFIELDVPKAGGGTSRWSIELNSPNNLSRQGWSRNALHSGDEVTVHIAPLRDGRLGGLFLDVTLPNGRVLDSGMPRGGTPVNVPNL